MERKHKLQELLIEIYSKFLGASLEELDALISNALERMGRFVDADRAYVGHYDYSKRLCHRTHEWCTPGIEPSSDEIAHVSLDTLAPMWQEHRQGRHFFVSDASGLPLNSLKDYLLKQKVKSMITLPMVLDEDCLGHVGFDAIKRQRFQADEEIQLLGSFAHTLVHLRERQRLDQKVQSLTAVVEQSVGTGKLSPDITLLKDAQAALQQKTDLLQSITDNMFDLVALADIQGNFTFVGKSHEILGYELEYLLGKNVMELIHPEDIPSVMAAYELFVTGSSEPRAEYRVLCKDGTYIWLETIGKLLKSADGEVAELLFSSREITERKAMDAILHATRQEYEDLAEQSPVGIITCDTVGNTTYVNPRVVEILGAPDIASVRQTNLLSHPRLVERGLSQRIDYAMKNNVMLTEELQYESSWGRRLDMKVHLKPQTKEGVVVGARLIIDDITREKEVERMLREQLRFQELVAEVSSRLVSADEAAFSQDIQWLLEQIGRYFDMDKACVYIFPPDDGEMQTMVWTSSEKQGQATPPSVRVSDMPWLFRQMEERRFIAFTDVRAMPPEAQLEKQHLLSQDVKSLLVAPLLSSSGVIGCLCLNHGTSKSLDIDSEQRLRVLANIVSDAYGHIQAERAYREAKEAAEAANEAKSRFLATMSHEIRTPLNGVMGMLQLLQLSELSETQESDVDVAYASAKTLLTLINEVLDYSKLQAEGVVLEQRTFPLAQLVRDVETESLALLSDKPVDFNVSIDSCVPQQVVGDAFRLKMVLMNLISNAVKFTASGSIDVVVSIAPGRQVASDTSDRIHLLFEVSDTGIGIEKDKLEEVFDRFTQADSATTRKYGGTGLGLAICKSLVTLMKGNIWAEKREGGGTRFVFTCEVGVHIPVDGGTEATQECVVSPLSYDRALAGDGYNVLVVDDDSTNRAVVRNIGRKSGWQVTEAEDGPEALAVLEGNSFDIILMDIRMPKMDGISTTKHIREAEAAGLRTHTPIVAMTANALEGDLEQYLAAGMDACVTKPFQFKQLHEIIRRLVQHQD